MNDFNISYKLRLSGISFLKALQSLIIIAFAVVTSVFIPSCSDNVDVKQGINEIEEGCLKINLAVPEPVTVATRDLNESSINNLEVFIFSGENNAFIQHNSVDSRNIVNNEVYLPLGDKARNSSTLIYAVANVEPSLINEITSVSDLRQFVLSDNFDNGYLPMIGFKTVNTATNNSPTISLYRNAAKISAKSSVQDVELTGIQLYRNSIKGYLGSPVNTEPEFEDFILNPTVATADPSIEDFKELKPLYTYPSKGGSKENPNSGAYCIVEVTKNETPQYYRINLRTEIDGELLYSDLLANHHYMITLKGFMTDGYASPEEAAKHPESDQFVVYTIHDHSSEVLSMVTDGVNELGVSPEVVLASLENGRKGTLVVKCYSPGETVSLSDISFEYDSEWLTIDNGKPHSDPTPDPNPNYDKDNAGQQFEFEISIVEGKNVYEDQKWDITVNWEKKALSRKVKVSYEAAFLLPKECTVSLSIKDNNNVEFAKINDYWTFITGSGTSVQKAGTGLNEQQVNLTPKLYGILPENMTGDKKRTGGFHFPMPYGEKQDGDIKKVAPWSYEYVIDFTNILDRDDTGSTISGIDVTLDGDAFIKSHVTWQRGAGNTVSLTLFDGKDSYEYAVGTVTFIISYSDDASPSKVSASLYHTGFFHYENDTRYVPQDKMGYYYYEVVPMGAGNDFWLDRNICASSNRSFIDIFDDLQVDRSAAGLHYTIINKPNDYQLPEFDFGMCPPGYHIPNQTEWDNLRLSSQFVTERVTYDNTVYMSTYYSTSNPKIGNIYLQKARFVNSNNIWETTPKFSLLRDNGDTGAGYYWSVTEAPAMEKEQMGNWLRALYLNGSASSYTNASVTDHRMPVRCKAGTPDEATSTTDYYVSLNVHEATHVFLFDTSNESYTPLYTFPGKAVGTTASSIKWQNFYCSTTIDPSHLRAIFVKLEEDGKVTIYTRQGNTFKTNVSYNTDYLLESNSWPIIQGAFYDFCETSETRDNNVMTTDYVRNNYPGKDYPTDCVTENDNTGGGGGGSMVEGDYEWSGWWASDDAWDGWQELGYGKYDWSKIKSCTISIDINIYWAGDAVLRFCKSQEGWPQVKEVRFTQNGDQIYTYTFTGDEIAAFAAANGMVIQGHKLGFRKVTLQVELID